MEVLDQELKPDQDSDRENDREQKIALFHRDQRPSVERHRVVTAAAPRMAAQQPPSRQQRAAPRPMPLDRFRRVVRATRVITARRRECRRYQQLVGADRSPQHQTQHAGRSAVTHHLDPPRPGPAGAAAAPLAAGRPAARGPSPGWAFRSACRVTCRSADAKSRKQLHIAPLPGAGSGDQDVIGPGPPVARQNFGRGSAQAPLRPVANDRIADLAARRKTDPYSRRAIDPGRGRRRLQHQAGTHRAAAGSCDTEKIGAGLQSYKAARHRCLTGGLRRNAHPAPASRDAARIRKSRGQADRRLRPFARRAAMTRRPPGVAIRARKPWRRLRISLLGW